MSKESPVICAIPHYNDPLNLENLLEQVTAEEYSHIYVLDDASTGEHKEQFEEVVGPYNRDEITVVRNSENVGAGQTRNRLMAEESVTDDTILHFLDSDVRLETTSALECNAGIARRVLPADSGIGMVGGLVYASEDRQMAYNFGPRFSLRTSIESLVQLRADRAARNGSEASVKWLRGQHLKFLEGWPDTTQEPKAQDTFWVSEANLLIRAGMLRACGGFSPYRIHDVIGLAIELRRRDQRCRFDPAIAVMHLEGGTSWTSTKDQLYAHRKLIGQYGWMNFLLGRD